VTGPPPVEVTSMGNAGEAALGVTSGVERSVAML